MTPITTPATTLTVETFRAADDGCLAYLVLDEASRTALALDPRLDQVDRFVDALAAREAHLAYALDTHTHADHLSGVHRLAQRTGATVLAHQSSKLRGPVRRVHGDETFALGGTAVTVLDAPGHTPDSLALLLEGHLFTGDALFAGGAGRTDFMGGSASDLFDTLRTFEALPDTTVVHPGHDYVGRAVTTVGEEKAQNPLLREHDRDAFVSRLSGRREPPANMAVILRHNLGEADAPVVAPAELRSRLDGDTAPFLLDVRTLLEYQSEHIEGARHIPLDQLDARVDDVPEGAEVVVVCRTGIRVARPRGPAGPGARWRDGGLAPGPVAGT